MPRHPTANRDLIRAINRSTVLNMIKNHGPLSRTAIAQRTGLSAATITAIAGELIQRGLVFEKEEGDSSGGRRPILLALNPAGGCVIGIKLAEDQITGALTDLKATILARYTAPITVPDLETVIETIAEVVETLLANARNRPRRFLGVGIGLAGIVDDRKGILRHSPIFGWKNVPLTDLMASQIGAPIYIDNDVNTLTITELWFGKGKGVDNFLTVTIGRGVGLGIVLNGQVYLGARGGVGEFGHTVIDPQGLACACGKHGCLETYVADPAILRMAGEAAARGELPCPPKNVDELVGFARSGNASAQHIFTHAGQVLGLGIANLINILNPELIIVSGEGVRAGDFLFEPMRAAVAANVMPGLAGDTQIDVEPWDDYAWARGAAGLVLQRLFESPVHRQPENVLMA
jgi:predicted NBD/HSP70 family sugar kinase